MAEQKPYPTAEIDALYAAAKEVDRAFECTEAYTINPALGSHCAACGCNATFIAATCIEDYEVAVAAGEVMQKIAALRVALRERAVPA